MAVIAPQTTLVQIRQKARNITGRPDQTQLSDAALDQYIQTFYFYDLPEHLRLFNLKETYTFSTQANVDSYAFDRNHYISLQPPLFIDGYQSFWSQSREQFYRVWPTIEFEFSAGSGTNVAFQQFTIPSSPILRAQPRYNGTYDSTILVCLNQPNANGLNTTIQSMIDDGAGNLIDASYALSPNPSPPPPLGSVNYLTGLFTINAPIPMAYNVGISTVPYNPGRPTSALFFDDRITLRPVPDSCYLVSIEAWRNPLEFLATTDSPELNEWWQLVALGASLKIFEDQGEIEEYAKFVPIFEKYKLLSLRRTIVQQTNQRTSSIYADQTTPGLYNNFWNRF